MLRLLRAPRLEACAWGGVGVPVPMMQNLAELVPVRVPCWDRTPLPALRKGLWRVTFCSESNLDLV